MPMFKKSSSVQVANAHPDTMWVRVRSERFTDYTRSRKVKTTVGAEIPNAGLDLNMTEDYSGDVTCQATYALRIEEGYVAVPSHGIATFRPATNFTHTVYTSVHREKENGEKEELATDIPSRGHSAVIITSGGGVVNAKKRRCPWVDINGTNHSSKKVGKSVKGCQAEFLLGCMEDELSKLGSDMSLLQKQQAGGKGEEEELLEMAEIIKRLTKNVEDFKMRPAIKSETRLCSVKSEQKFRSYF